MPIKGSVVNPAMPENPSHSSNPNLEGQRGSVQARHKGQKKGPTGAGPEGAAGRLGRAGGGELGALSCDAGFAASGLPLVDDALGLCFVEQAVGLAGEIGGGGGIGLSDGRPRLADAALELRSHSEIAIPVLAGSQDVLLR